MMIEGWTEREFIDCVKTVRVDRKKQVKRRDYQECGEYPVVDQGQTQIAGWTNNYTNVISEGLPYIIFGDHTRIFKYVDYEFVLGADGTKLIKPIETINPRFFYYALLSIPIPSRGYSRHYRLLKEQTIPLPPLPEQRKIAAILLKLQNAISIQDKIIQSLTDLKKSTMHHLFTYGLKGEKTKMTDFGPVPSNWVRELLDDCCTVQTGVAKGRKFDADETIELPYLRVANVQDGHLDLSEMKKIRIRRKEKNRYMLKEGDVVLTEGGDFDKLGRGFVWEDQIPDCVHQNHVFAVRVDKTRLVSRFLAYLAQSPYGKAYFLKVAHKTTNLACINTTKLKGFPLQIPEMDEQKEMVGIISEIDSRIMNQRSKKTNTQSLLKITLNKLMNGEIRVTGLDFDSTDYEPRKYTEAHGKK